MHSLSGEQLSLLGGERPNFDASALGRMPRRDLGFGAWMAHYPGWLRGHQQMFESLRRNTHWHAQRRWMFERMVDVPRLVASLPADGPVHPVIGAMADCLSMHTGWPLENVGLAYYRDGRDSVALHGDKLGSLRTNSVIALISVGEPRRFVLKPVADGASLFFSLGWGDLLLMGGTCQETYLHGVPKVADAGPRISIQLRPSGPPDQNRI